MFTIDKLSRVPIYEQLIAQFEYGIKSGEIAPDGKLPSVRELSQQLSEDAYAQAKFYDTKQRTRHAALTAWERFLKEYPDSPHAEEARARIEVLQLR